MHVEPMSLFKISVYSLLASHFCLSFGRPATDSDAVPSAPTEEAKNGVLAEVVVVGLRANLASAQAIKRDKLEIVDSVVADDISKLPEFSIADALQRVTGVQIARDRGDGTGTTIRGLSQMETTLNRREVFTAGAGRNLDFADIASEMVAGIDVYKTSSAEHIEGGVGGMIDLRTRSPFDFKGREVVGSTQLLYGDLVDRNATQFFTLASNRWKTDSAGELGALVTVAYQERAFREDQKSTGNPLVRSDLLPGQTVVAPNGTTESISLGGRQRGAVSGMLQWFPMDQLELYADASYVEFDTRQNTYQVNVSAPPAAVPGSASLFPATNDVSRVTWSNAPVSILSFARDTLDRTKQAAVGAIWYGKGLTLKSDLGYTHGSSTLFFSGLTLGATAASFTQDLSTAIPATEIRGVNLQDPAQLHTTGIAYRARRYEGDQCAARLDGDYALSDGFIHTFMSGVRLARRGANNASGLVVADAPVLGMPATATPEFTVANPYGFFPGSASIRNTLVGNLDTVRDAQRLRKTLGVASPIPDAASALSLWAIDEQTQAVYFMARFGGGAHIFADARDRPWDGNFGLRVVNTQERVAGFQAVPATGGVEPIRVDRQYTDHLPSANLRYQFGAGVFLRAAVSKTLTRPSFDQLSPSLTLVPNAINPSLNQGSAGNPDLKPIRADNLDVAVEKYINKTTALHLTGFLKKVDGFVSTLSQPEVVDGVVYQVSRPRNSAAADIRGLELGYQQMYDFLPSWLSGLGLQANYTYIDSQTQDRLLGENVALQNLSRNSVNLIGMYEKGRISGRIAYNWRDQFLSGVANIVGVGALPIYTKAYGWLDASLNYRFTDSLTMALAGTNLLRTVRSSYYGVETRPQSSWINDTQLSVAVTARF